MVVLLVSRRSAMTRRMPLRAMVWSPSPAGIAATALAAGAAELLAAPPFGALFTSAATMRPPGPVPVRRERSTPSAAAIFLASGEAFTRPPEAGAASAFAGVADGAAAALPSEAGAA